MPISTQIEDIWQQFSQELLILDHNRPIQMPCDDSLVQIVRGKQQVLRLGRGLAPWSEPITEIHQSIGAFGAQQKSTLGFAANNHWLISPYIGDLEDIATQKRYRHTFEHFQKLYQLNELNLVSDQHPQYFSSQFAKQLGAAKKREWPEIQHHYAHILAVIAEHKLGAEHKLDTTNREYKSTKVLGVAFDGTGLGDDGKIWGGEFLLADQISYQRIGHLRYFRLIGKIQAIRDPKRLVYALLLEVYSVEQIMAFDLHLFRDWSEDDFYNLYQIWKNPRLSPQTSSVGRLFDAFAALLQVCEIPDYEGEAGIVMQYWANLKTDVRVELADSNFRLKWQGLEHDLTQSKNQTTDDNLARELMILDYQPMLEACMSLLSNQNQLTEHEKSQYCAEFVRQLAICVAILKSRFEEIPLVLGGGVFQNTSLIDAICEQCPQDLPYFNQNIPTNDAGIVLGQLYSMLDKLK